MKKILVTGAAGFIGFHLSLKLLQEKYQVIGLDNVNDYYDVNLKKSRLDVLHKKPGFSFYKENISDKKAVQKIFETEKPDIVVHLAAQAGVRYSLENPDCYVNTNEVGFFNVIDMSKKLGVENFVFASSSSVYGSNKKIPFSVSDPVDHPISLYAATKKANELVAHTYSHLYGLNCTGFRFFTVYGPYGRPDMALFIFTKSIIEKRPIKVYNLGKMKRDFTYIDDIVQGLYLAVKKPFKYEIFNLGNNKTVKLSYFIECIENELGLKANKEFLPIQPGDVPETWADIDRTKELLGYNPSTSIEKGIKNFIAWYKEYYNI